MMQDGVHAASIKAFLLERRINVSTSSRSSTRLDFEQRGLPETVVRASVHYYNSSEDIDQLVQAVSEVQ
jgi:selenocysteine lyase/cysteine desulfurase